METTFTPEDAKLIKEIVRLVSRYPETVRVLMAAHDAKEAA